MTKELLFMIVAVLTLVFIERIATTSFLFPVLIVTLLSIFLIYLAGMACFCYKYKHRIF